MADKRRTVWITGASSGLGRYTAQALGEAGFCVIAGARSFTGDKAADGIFRLPLDVTREESVEAFQKAALAISERVDAVVHCAGVLVLGPCEKVPVEEYRRVLETNYLGVVHMNQAVLPLMREQGGGKIIIFSSINGLLGTPFQSAYTASKHALEGYAECLAMETKSMGIQVCLVEPGDHRGGSQAYRAHIPVEQGSPYAAPMEHGIAVINRDESGGSDPARLGRRVARLLLRRKMPLRVCIASADQHLAVWMHRLLPAGACMEILRKYYLGKAANAPHSRETENGHYGGNDDNS